jgi:hypothetical protein
VLGLQEEVAKFNSLPPSLFMPLSALVAQRLGGAPVIRPVGVPELQRYDKWVSFMHSGAAYMKLPGGCCALLAESAALVLRFIDSRTPTGSTQVGLQAATQYQLFTLLLISQTLIS